MSSRSSVDRAPARCSGGHGFDSCWGLRFFLCPTLVLLLIISPFTFNFRAENSPSLSFVTFPVFFPMTSFLGKLKSLLTNPLNCVFGLRILNSLDHFAIFFFQKLFSLSLWRIKAINARDVTELVPICCVLFGQQQVLEVNETKWLVVECNCN